MNVYDFVVKAQDGSEVALEAYNIRIFRTFARLNFVANT